MKLARLPPRIVMLLSATAWAGVKPAGQQQMQQEEQHAYERLQEVQVAAGEGNSRRLQRAG
jgi:hypothetical protein